MKQMIINQVRFQLQEEHDFELTIGIESPKYVDYFGDYLSVGMKYVTFPTTEDRNFRFGVC